MSRKINYFGSYTSFNGLFDLFGFAKAGYSLRKLSNLYAGFCIRVRRGSDNSEFDIGFINNELDIASLLSFIGSNNGHVVVWYDQSGNGLNLSQINSGNQPLIVVGGVLVTEGGKAAISYNNDYLFNNTQQIFDDGNYYCHFVLRVDTQNQYNPRYSAINGAGVNIQFAYNSANRYATRRNNQTNLTSSGFTTRGSRNLLNHYAKNNVDYFSHNSIDYSFSNTGAPTANSGIGNGIHLLKGYIENSWYVNTGTIQEFLFYDIDKSSVKTQIENNTNNYFSIYP